MKALRTAVIVVGAAALVASGVGALAGAGLIGAGVGASATFLGVSAATWGAIGAIGATVAAVGGALTAGRPSFGGGGSPTDFTTNPQSGLPYAIGRTRMSGLKIDGKTSATPGWTTTHDLVWFAALLSIAGPVQAIESFTADNVAVTFDPTTGNATSGEYPNWMAQKVYLGAPSQATGLSLSLNGGSFPGWPRKLSGMAHALWGLRHDSDGKHYGGGVPEPSWVGYWVKVYDPRKDSTYPGGSGSHRSNDEATWEWSRNPALHALTWAIGRTQNGKRICGIGAPIASIRVADFVEAANVADANGWGCGGVEWTTDSKWDIFKRMLQAGGAVPTKTGAMIGCRVKTPRVSLGTIQEADFLDGITYVATKGRRNRFNTVVPRYVSEAHNWQVIAGSEIGVPAYVTADGGKRTKGIDFPLVQDEIGQAGFDGKKQAGQLAAYEIVDSREASVEFTTKPKWIGLRTGDCVTLNSPQDDIVNMKVVITSRTVDPATMTIRFTAETETDSKHAFALGQTSTPPPAPTLSVPAGRPAVPSLSDWSITAVTIGDGLPALRVSGAIGDLIADRLLVQYRAHGTTIWRSAPDIIGSGAQSVDIGPLDGAEYWDVRIAYKAGDQRGDWLEVDNILTGSNSLISNLESLLAAGARIGTSFPSASDSAAGQIFIRSDLGNRIFLRLEGGAAVTIGGDPVTIGGNSIDLPPWAEVSDARVAQLQLAVNAAEALAQDAIALLDGKIATFYQTTEPAGASEGDLWFDTDDGNNQYRFNGSAWVDVQDSAIGDALAAAAGAQGTADGKVTTFVSESAPTAEAVGDLWYKASTKELRRWNGLSWALILGNLSQHDLITPGLHDPDNGYDLDGAVPGTFLTTVSASAPSGGVATTGSPYALTTPSLSVGSSGDFIVVSIEVVVAAATGAYSVYASAAGGSVTARSFTTGAQTIRFDAIIPPPHTTGSSSATVTVSCDTATVVNVASASISFTRGSDK